MSRRLACYNFVSVKRTSLSQECIIYSPPFEWTAPPHSPKKTLRQRQQKPDWCGSVFGKPLLIFDASTTICTRPNSRAAPLFPNLNCNLCPTLTARVPGLGQITWWIVTKKMRGNSGKTLARKSRNSCRVNSRSCGCIGKVDSGPKCAHSQN